VDIDCEHKKLMFGSGDYYIFCEECHKSWIMEDDHKNNVGLISQHLSGEFREKIGSGREIEDK